jgi:hypothetical protein
MKRVIFFLSLLLFTSVLFSQDSAILQSKFERFSSSTGKMYKYETEEMGGTKEIKISVSKVTDMEKALSEKAILISQTKSILFTPYITGILTVDIEEIDGLLKALDYYKTEIKGTKPKNDLLYIYVTSNDIVLSCSYTESFNTGWTLIIYQRYHYLKTGIPYTNVVIKNKDIDDFATLLIKAKNVSF